MNGEVIKSFLVGIGFGVDDASLANFNRAIASATLKVSALYASVSATATGITFGISKISESFEHLGYEYKILAPAINKALVLRQELLKAYSAAGVNLNKVIQDSVKLNISLTKTRYAFEAIYKSVASRFFEVLTKQSDLFRQRIYANLPKIQLILENLIKNIFKAIDVMTSLGERLWSVLQRVYEFFVRLDNVTNGWSTIILAAVAAWKLLNLGFLATPLGLLFTLGTTLLALWDDFKTFREGGRSLINWGSDTTKMIVGVTAAVVGLSAAIVTLASVYTLFTNAARIASVAQAALNVVMALNPIGLLIIAITALVAGLTALDAKWNLFGGKITSFFSGIGGKILDWAGGPSTAPTTAPLGSQGGSNTNFNQSVHQQTSISVQGVSDAQSVGKAVGNEQGKVNFDLCRNFAGVCQ